MANSQLIVLAAQTLATAAGNLAPWALTLDLIVRKITARRRTIARVNPRLSTYSDASKAAQTFRRSTTLVTASAIVLANGLNAIVIALDRPKTRLKINSWVPFLCTRCRVPFGCDFCLANDFSKSHSGSCQMAIFPGEVLNKAEMGSENERRSPQLPATNNLRILPSFSPAII